MLSYRNPNIVNEEEPIGNVPRRSLDHLDCGICHQLFHNPMSVSPCLHTFCCGCVSRWYLTNPTCPICRIPCTDLVENREKRELVKTAILEFPERSRSNEDMKQLDKFEKEYLVKYLIHWSPEKLFLIQSSSTIASTTLMYPLILMTQAQTTYNTKMNRLQALRIQENNNSEHNLIPIQLYLEEKEREDNTRRQVYQAAVNEIHFTSDHRFGLQIEFSESIMALADAQNENRPVAEPIRFPPAPPRPISGPITTIRRPSTPYSRRAGAQSARAPRSTPSSQPTRVARSMRSAQCTRPTPRVVRQANNEDAQNEEAANLRRSSRIAARRANN